MRPPIILPTNDALTEVFRLSQEMQSFEFDIEECIRAVLDSLIYAQNYPHTFESEVMFHEPRAVQNFSTVDLAVLNQMLRVLYDRVYQAFCAMRLYDVNGRCYYDHFSLDHGNILVWTQPFADVPST